MGTYRTVTREAGEFRVTVRETVGMDEIDAGVVFSALDYDRKSARVLKRVSAFANAVLRTVDVQGLSFEWANADSEPSVIQAAFDCWQAAPVAIVRAWESALYEVDKAPNAGEA